MPSNPVTLAGPSTPRVCFLGVLLSSHFHLLFGDPWARLHNQRHLQPSAPSLAIHPPWQNLTRAPDSCGWVDSCVLGGAGCCQPFLHIPGKSSSNAFLVLILPLQVYSYTPEQMLLLNSLVAVLDTSLFPLLMRSPGGLCVGHFGIGTFICPHPVGGDLHVPFAVRPPHPNWQHAGMPFRSRV
jgi:hypothetical protein